MYNHILSSDSALYIGSIDYVTDDDLAGALGGQEELTPLRIGTVDLRQQVVEDRHLMASLREKASEI